MPPSVVVTVDLDVSVAVTDQDDSFAVAVLNVIMNVCVPGVGGGEGVVRGQHGLGVRGGEPHLVGEVGGQVAEARRGR